MTVIAFDGKTLAADKRATSGDGALSTMTKIRNVRGALVAHTGDSYIGVEMLAWFEAGAQPDRFPETAKADKATLIVIRRGGKAELYTTGPHAAVHERAPMAFGCGRDFAMAAMSLGRTAAEAVALTCELNAFCGNGIDTLTLEP